MNYTFFLASLLDVPHLVEGRERREPLVVTSPSSVSGIMEEEWKVVRGRR